MFPIDWDFCVSFQKSSLNPRSHEFSTTLTSKNFLKRLLFGASASFVLTKLIRKESDTEVRYQRQGSPAVSLGCSTIPLGLSTPDT